MSAVDGGSLDPRQAELLSALADNELVGDERAEADALLAGSEDARAEYAALYHTREAVRALPMVEPPAGFFEAMVAAGTPRSGPAPAAWPEAPTAAAPVAWPTPAATPTAPPTPASWPTPGAATPGAATPGTEDELAARRARRRGPVVAAVAGIAAAAVVLGGVVGPDAAVRPPLEDVAAAQGGALPPGDTGPVRPGGQDFQTVRSADDLGDHPAPPDELGDGGALLETLAATSGEGVLAVYENDGELVTVYRQEGDVDWGELPDGVRATVDGDETWQDLTTDGFERVIVRRGDAIYTLVGDAEADVLVDIGLELPEEEPSTSILDALRRAARGLVDLF